MVANRLLFLVPSVGAQAQHVIVGKARAAKRSRKNRFLFVRRIEPEAVGALDVQVSHNKERLCENQRHSFLPCIEERGFPELFL